MGGPTTVEAIRSLIGLAIFGCGIVVGVCGVFVWFALSPSPGSRSRRRRPDLW
jgi:hypothetical protein